jgi:hypothetical protein
VEISREGTAIITIRNFQVDLFHFSSRHRP